MLRLLLDIYLVSSVKDVIQNGKITLVKELSELIEEFVPHFTLNVLTISMILLILGMLLDNHSITQLVPYHNM